MLIGVLTGCVHALVSLDEACLFVGARFARVGSSCKNGLCSGLYKRPTGEFSTTSASRADPLCCVDALNVFQEFFGHTASFRPNSSCTVARELLDDIRTKVLVNVVRLTYGAVGSANLSSVFSEVEDRMRCPRAVPLRGGCFASPHCLPQHMSLAYDDFRDRIDSNGDSLLF